MDVKAGDRVALDAGHTAARVVDVLEDGSIEALIEQDGHPANGAATLVRAGNFEVIAEDAELKPVPVEEPTKPIQAESIFPPEVEKAWQGRAEPDQLDEYHTVTR
jgi:hypothetical protein